MTPPCKAWIQEEEPLNYSEQPGSGCMLRSRRAEAGGALDPGMGSS